MFSALILHLTYGLGNRAYNARVGLIGALFVTVAVIPVGQAHQALPDSAMAFWAALCFYLAWQLYTRGRTRDYALAGVVAGLVVAAAREPL